MARDVRDHYPTPPDAVLALVHAIREHSLVPAFNLAGRWVEPSCGRGAILRWFGVPAERWLAVELDPELAAVAEQHACGVVVGDALAVDWPADHNAITNPPFTALDAFLKRMLRQVDKGNTAICLTRSGYFDEPPRAWLRRPNTRPDYEVKLCWRISFTGDGNTDYATYSWWIWNDLAPKAATVKIWAERPKIRAHYWDEYKREVLGHRGPAQAELAL